MDNHIEKIKEIGIKSWIRQNPNGKKLIKRLMKKYATAYYEGNALISDYDFDILVDTLKTINPHDKYLNTPGWGYKIKNGIKHIYGKVGTLPYYYDYSNIINIFNGEPELIITPKFDGINFVSYYKKGKFQKCATRGNGNTGKNISWAFTNDYCLSVDLSKKTFAINGEVIYLGSPQKENNFRNKVATYLNKKDKINSKIRFIPFGLINTHYTHDYLMQILEINKISKIKIPYTIHNKLPSEETLECLFKKYKEDFEIDGLVITNRSKTIQIAYKFKEELK